MSREPGGTAAELVRLDLSPTLRAIYSAYSVGSYGEQVLGQPSEPGDRRPSTDFYLWMNGGLLVSLIALPIVVVLTLLGVI